MLSGFDRPDQNSKLSDPKEWIDRHGNALLAHVLRFVSDRSQAEDLIQETLLAALKGRDRFTGTSSERTWLIGILKNKVVDYYRKSGREISVVQPEELLGSDDPDYDSIGSWQPNRRPQAWSVDSNDPVEEQQFWDHLQHCLGGLEARLAQVYTLRDMMETDYQEVCNVLSITPTNLRVMLHRARKLLRRCLETNWIDR